MRLFMLKHHDQAKAETRELALNEIDTVFGADLNWTPPGEEPDCDGGTTCNTLIVTPNADGSFTVDCDAA